MSSEYENKLEAEIHRELTGLAELSAPRSLASRVMAAVETRLEVPWYRQSWQMWPLAVRGVSLVLLMALFAGLCFGAWKLSHLQTVTTAMQRPMNWLSTLGAIGHVFGVLGNAVLLAVKQLGTGVLITWAAALALGCAMCAGIGRVYLRLALVRR